MRLLTFVFIFIHLNFVYSQNYIDFQKNITRAEIAILDSNYTEAMETTHQTKMVQGIRKNSRN